MRVFDSIKEKLLYHIWKDENRDLTISLFLENLNGLQPNVLSRKHLVFDKIEEYFKTIDIRNVNILIDKCIELKIFLPDWVKNKQFTIDYNENLQLDLIK